MLAFSTLAGVQHPDMVFNLHHLCANTTEIMVVAFEVNLLVRSKKAAEKAEKAAKATTWHTVFLVEAAGCPAGD